MYDFCLTIPYGVVLTVGGFAGFAISGSTTSLVAGGLSGALLSFVGYCSYNEYKQSPVTSKLWPAISLAVSMPLAVVMGNRFVETNVFFPAGLVGAYSAGMTGFYVWLLCKESKPQYKKKAKKV